MLGRLLAALALVCVMAVPSFAHPNYPGLRPIESGKSDRAEILTTPQAKKRVIHRPATKAIYRVTADRGCADMRQYSPGSHAGIIVLQAPAESRRRYVALAEAAARTLELERLTGCLVTVTPGRVRIRRPSA
jgi:hypothetical protein